jgi:hypothetical protein
MERGAGRRASREGGRLWMRLLALVGVLLLGSYTCELCSDRLSHFRPDAGDTLDPVGRSRELVKRGDVVPLQNNPGLQGQTQTWNGTFTNSPGVTGHLPRLLPSGCGAASPAQMASSAGDSFLGELFHRCGMIPDVEQADGAAPPPNEGIPRCRLLHPQGVECSPKPLQRGIRTHPSYCPDRTKPACRSTQVTATIDPTLVGPWGACCLNRRFLLPDRKPYARRYAVWACGPQRQGETARETVNAQREAAAPPLSSQV